MKDNIFDKAQSILDAMDKSPYEITLGLDENNSTIKKAIELGKLYKELNDTSPFRQPQKHTEIENKIKELENE